MALSVLYLDHAAEMGGAEFSLLELLTALQASGEVTPTVATPGNGVFAQQLAEAGIEVLPLEIPQSARHFSREEAHKSLALMQQAPLWWKPIQQIRAWLADRPADILHTNTLKMHSVGSILAKLHPMPMVWHLRDIPSHRGNGLKVLKLAAGISTPTSVIAISNAVRESIASIKAAKGIRVIHDGFDTRQRPPASSRPEPGSIRQLLGLPQDVKIAVCVGFFIPWKGQRYLLEAFADLYDLFPDWHLALIGRPIFQFQDEQTKLETLAQQLGIAERVHFLGEQRHIVDKLPAFDLFVCPSTQEPMGRVVLEAMAAGVPIVATQAGGIPDLVTNEEHALLVPPADAGALAHAMATLMTQPDYGTQLARAAQERLYRHLTLNQAVDQVLALYREVLPRV